MNKITRRQITGTLALAFAVLTTACSGEIGLSTPTGSWGAYWYFNTGNSGSAAPGATGSSGGSSGSTTSTTPATKKSSTATHTTTTANIGGSNYTAEIPNGQVPQANGSHGGTYVNPRAGLY